MREKRQAKIRELITNFQIETQTELAKRLQQAGFPVTQATVSRDIREMKLSKQSVDDKHRKYVLPKEMGEHAREKYVRVLQSGYISMELAENILVVKTVEGMAMAVAAAIDAMELEEVLGSIAGDDTIFCALRSKTRARELMKNLRKIIAEE